MEPTASQSSQPPEVVTLIIFTSQMGKTQIWSDVAETAEPVRNGEDSTAGASGLGDCS